MTTIQSAIVGAKHHPGAYDKLFHAADGTPVTLVREPDNPHDPNAIRCEVEGVMCGYVPRAQAERLAADLDSGKALSASLRQGTKLVIDVTDGEAAEAPSD